MIPPKYVTEESNQLLINQMLKLVKDLFNRSSSIIFLETQQELISAYVLHEHQNSLNDEGAYKEEICDILHRANIQSLFLLELEQVFKQLEKT